MNYFDAEDLKEISLCRHSKTGKIACSRLIKDNIKTFYARENKILIENYIDKEYGMIKFYCHASDNELCFEFYDPLLKERKKVSLRKIDEQWIENTRKARDFVNAIYWRFDVLEKIKEIIEEENELLTLINKHNKKQCQRPFKIMPKYVLVGNFPKHMMLYMPKQDKLMFRCKGKIVSQNISQYDMRRYFETYDISILFDAEREYYRSHRMREDISWCLG